MVRNRAGKLAALLTAAGILAFGAAFGLQHEAPQQADEPASLAFRSDGPDVDGDHRPDYVRADGVGVDVIAATGIRLLAFETPVLQGYQLMHLGGEYPALFVQTAPLEWAAFTYDPGIGMMRMIAWPDGRQRGYGHLTPDGALEQTVVGSGGARPLLSQYRLEGAHLQVAATAYQPLLKQRATPSEALAAAVEAVAYGLKDEVKVHFADPAQAEAFYSHLKRAVPAGAVLVAQADEVNAGAEHGHRVPVKVWVSTHATVVGLEGEAEFTVAGGGARIRSVALRPVKLAVNSWAQAVALVKGRGGADAQPSGAPFYGLFRLEAAGRSFAVDARTGEVETE